MVRSPTLTYEVAPGGLRPRLTQQVQALVYSLNRQLQRAYLAANIRYIHLLQRGGDGAFLGRKFHILGLEGAQKLLAELPRGQRLDALREFVRDARLAREARAASLVAVLVVLPVVFLALVPREIVPAAGWVSEALPFVHAVRFFASALYDVHPRARVLEEALWLVGLGTAFSLLARLGMRRLTA